MKKRLRYSVLAILLACSMSICMSTAASAAATAEQTEKEADRLTVKDLAAFSDDEWEEYAYEHYPLEKIESKKKKAPFELTMLNVKQGLSLLIRSGEHYMIYDGGGRKRSSYVVSYLQKKKIDKLDYLFASHYDEDHISGLIGIMNTMEVEEAVIPDYESDTKIYASFMKKLKEKDIPVVYPEEADVFELGDATVTVIHADPDAEKENDRSTMIVIDYGLFSCIITGDAEGTAEEETLDAEWNLTADLYVAGHHGSAYSSTEAFVNAIAPRFAWISVGKDNSYGHPADETLQILNDYDCEIYRTDEQKEVTLYTDGMTRLWFSDEPSTDSFPGFIDLSSDSSQEAAASGNRSLPAEEQTDPASINTSAAGDASTWHYILNVNTGKFHYPECKSVKQMKDKNKREFDCTRDDLITQGYSPCQNCNP